QSSPVHVKTNAVTDPIALTATPIGNLYVLSRSTATITEYNSSGGTVGSISGTGSSPTGLDVDSAGNVYVALSGNHQVSRFKPSAGTFQLDTSFNATGKIGRSDGTPGSNTGEFNTPIDVAVSPD